MKFAVKLMLSVTILISLLFCAGGTYFVEQNFDHTLNTAAEQNADQHTLQKYALESNMLGYLLNGETYSDEMYKCKREKSKGREQRRACK